MKLSRSLGYAANFESLSCAIPLKVAQLKYIIACATASLTFDRRCPPPRGKRNLCPFLFMPSLIGHWMGNRLKERSVELPRWVFLFSCAWVCVQLIFLVWLNAHELCHLARSTFHSAPVYTLLLSCDTRAIQLSLVKRVRDKFTVNSGSETSYSITVLKNWF